jgi:hypothetical protein
MRIYIYIIIIVSLIAFSCSNSVESNSADNEQKQEAVSNDIIVASTFLTKENGRRIVVGDIANACEFYGDTKLGGRILGDDNFLSIYGQERMRLAALNLEIVGKVNFLNETRSNNYLSADGSTGKSYTEEFKDGDGNIRTRIFKNGLLVDYLINGVSVFP